jgi:hypothetical protein
MSFMGIFRKRRTPRHSDGIGQTPMEYSNIV